MTKLATLTPAGAVRHAFREALGAPGAATPRDTLALFADALRYGIEQADLGGAPAALALELAAQSGLGGRDLQAFYLLALSGLAALRSGSTHLPLAGDAGRTWVRDRLATLVARDPADPAAPDPGWTADAALAAITDLLTPGRCRLIGGRGDYVPLIVDAGRVYHQRMFVLEGAFVGALAALRGRPPKPAPADLDAHVAEIETHPLTIGGSTIVLAPEQREAMLAPVRHPLTVISGGPGTGKTTVIVSMLRLLVRLGVPPAKVLLAAPTGKAANQIKFALEAQLAGVTAKPDVALRDARLEAKTLHRLLGYHGGTEQFSHHAGNRLDAEVVIIDEASMVDVFLMTALVAALPDDATLVLIGDAHQLPSVDAGAVLRDLVPDDPAVATPGVVRLVRVQRTKEDAPIAVFARQINAGQAEAVLDGLKRVPAKTPYAYQDVAYLALEAMQGDAGALRDARKKNRDTVEAFFAAWYADRVAAAPAYVSLLAHEFDYTAGAFSADDVRRLTTLFDHVHGARVLSATRGRFTGSEGANKFFHAKQKELTGYKTEVAFFPGEPVMMLQNDYRLEIYNGDQGIVARVRMGPGGASRRMAVFKVGNEFRPLPLASLERRIEHSFAMTVHKSQGSEYAHVAVLLPDETMPIVNRQILYTALTRAKTSALIVGVPAVVEAAVGTPDERWTGVA